MNKNLDSDFEDSYSKEAKEKLEFYNYVFPA